jgi:hypothetical protein
MWELSEIRSEHFFVCYCNDIVRDVGTQRDPLQT